MEEQLKRLVMCELEQRKTIFGASAILTKNWVSDINQLEHTHFLTVVFDNEKGFCLTEFGVCYPKVIPIDFKSISLEDLVIEGITASSLLEFKEEHKKNTLIEILGRKIVEDGNLNDLEGIVQTDNNHVIYALNNFSWDLSQVIEILQWHKDRGVKLARSFNEHTLYSTESPEDMYKKVYEGRTKEEYEEYRTNSRQERERRQEEARRKIPIWIEEGNKLVFSARKEEWESFVNLLVNEGIYDGNELECAIDLIGKLEEGATVEDVGKMLKSKNTSGAAEYAIESIIFNFSKRGPEFWGYQHRNDMSLKSRVKILLKKMENRVLAFGERMVDNMAQRMELEQELTRLSFEKSLLSESVNLFEKMISRTKERLTQVSKQFAKHEEEQGRE